MLSLRRVSEAAPKAKPFEPVEWERQLGSRSSSFSHPSMELGFLNRDRGL